MTKKDYQDKLNELGIALCDITETFGEDVPAYEIGVRMIAHAVSMLLYCAPNELIGVKTIMAAVEIGINEYEINHS